MYRIGKEETDSVKRVFDAKDFFRPASLLKETETFEKEWAEKIGSKYCLCVNGGTSALIGGLVGLGIGPGDEVIVPGYTFMASALAVLAVGAIPVIAEVDDTLTIDPNDIEKKISKYTRAVMPVHIVGFPSNMDAITAIASKYRLKVIEDACQADGGSYKGKRLGSWGTVGAFSFNHYKIITCGEGGCLVTDDIIAYERALVNHDGGTAFRPYAKDLSIPVFAGVNNRVSEISGAILRVQLQRLDNILFDLRKAKKKLMDKLSVNSKVTFARSNDIEGDCGSYLGISFEDGKLARAFAASEGINGFLPINSDKHVYCNWDPILEKRGSHHPALNPYSLPQNQGLNMNYSRDMCPKTLDILGRTFLIDINPDWTEENIDHLAECCIKSIERI